MGDKPLAIELFAGTGSGTAGWVEAGGRAVCFDLQYLPHHGVAPAGSHRVIQDVLTLHGSQFKDAAWIWASPPCQNYSYLAMPWSRSTDPENSKAAKALRKKWETEGPDNRLFDACFRIQREANEATGDPCPDCKHLAMYTISTLCHRCDCTGRINTRYIPLIVENVRGAVPWVGKRDMPLDQWNRLTQAERIELGRPAATYGSFCLWGDVACIGNRVVAGRELADIRAGRGRFGMGVVPLDENGTKIGGDWFSDPNSTCRKHGSRSNARRAASALIAKIPTALSEYVARVHLPVDLSKTTHGG